MSTPIEHLDIPIGEIHFSYNWEYADEAAREAAAGLVPGDVGKFARQLDNNTIWMLTDDSPVTWVRVGGVVSDSFALTGDISPAQITSNQDDYNPTGLADASVLRLNTDASRNITSIAGGADGRILIIHNVGSFNIVLKDDDGATGTASNRFALSADLTLGADEGAIIHYDSTSSRWRLFAASRAASGSGSGDVVGPASATDNAIARYNSSTGKLIQDSNLTLPDDAATTEVGYMNIPQNSQSADYTTVMADRGKHIYHPTSDDNPRTFTIDSNANVAYPIGTAITFVNDQNSITIAITSDTLVWAEDGSTGSRTLSENGMATAIKVTSTRWIVSGTGLSAFIAACGLLEWLQLVL